jgi:hypothetical protein
MNYIDEIAVQIAQALDDPSPPQADMALYRIYALLALTTGIHTTLENVHDAWSAWEACLVPDHRSIVPFDQLTTEVQELDRKYANAIRMVAALLSMGTKNYSFVPV